MLKTFLFQAIQFSQTVLIQTVQFSIIIIFVYTQLNIETVLFQVIQFSISMQFTSIWPIDRTLSDVPTPGQSGSGSDGNEGILYIPQISSITGTSPSDCLESYPGHMLEGGTYSSAEKPFGVFYSPSRLGKRESRESMQLVPYIMMIF